MDSIIKFLNWLLTSVLMAIIFWFFWVFCGLGSKYFPFIPAQFQAPPLLDIIGLFIAIQILMGIFSPNLFRGKMRLELSSPESDT